MQNQKKKLIKKNQEKPIDDAEPLCNSTPKKFRDLNLIASTIVTKKKRKYHKTKQKHNGCRKEIVKRLFSPFSKFYKARPEAKPNKMIGTYEGTYKKTGLSPKEKCYLINTCQKRTTRYSRLKNLANDAIKNKKIFQIHGQCNALREALIERGWVEKIPPHLMNLETLRNRRRENRANNDKIHLEFEKLFLSNFVEKYPPYFIWNAKEKFKADTQFSNSNEIKYNKLRGDAKWTTKHGLCAVSQNHHWFYIEDIAEVNTPRTYTCSDKGEREEFVMDYKLTACTSLLKWVLSMVANDRPIFLDTGSTAINVIVFALNRCKEFLFFKENKDIDKCNVSSVTNGQWNGFLKKYYGIIAKQDTFKTDNDNKLPLYLGYAKYLLREIHKHRPQLSCEGCHNIWIIKPAHCSRGRGIRMASKLGVLTDLLNRGKYVFQKYIEEPLLLHETKFDIRQYYLVTSMYPLVIWMYKECYLKFSSQKYSLKNYHESIHLTNNAVQKNYKNCPDRHPELPPHNMWDLETYKKYLFKIDKEDVWDQTIYPGMKKSIIGVMLSCQESVTYGRNRFELYGCDFILDKDFKPWLIEINSCPDLNPTTQVTAKICAAVLKDTLKVVIDHAADPKSPTGNFECIYNQVIGLPRYRKPTDLIVHGHSLPDEYFYKGYVKIDDSSEHSKLDKEQDIGAMLHKLKLMHESDIMIKPETSNYIIEKNEKQSFKNNSESEQKLNEVVTVIENQLNDLLDRVTSVSAVSASRKNSSVSSPSSINLLKKSIFQDINSTKLSGIKSLLNLSINQLSQTLMGKEEQHFNFSKLDDGSEGKGSGSLSDSISIEENKTSLLILNDKKMRVSDNSTKKLIEKIVIMMKKEVDTLPKNPDAVEAAEQNTPSFENVKELTDKLYIFLNKKQREYNIDVL